MQFKAIKASVVVVALAMAGCTQPGQDGPGNKQVLGTVGGAALVGLVGARFGKAGACMISCATTPSAGDGDLIWLLTPAMFKWLGV